MGILLFIRKILWPAFKKHPFRLLTLVLILYPLFVLGKVLKAPGTALCDVCLYCRTKISPKD